MPIDDGKSLSKRIDDLGNAKVLCIGDIILDHFVYGDVERVSPEAPVPVVKVHHKAQMLGGAGNVVRNITSLGAKACFITVIGDDNAGSRLISLVADEPNIEPYLQSEKGRLSSEKTRYIARNQHILRTDFETTADVSQQTEKSIFKIAKSEIKNNDIVILSDYAKGLLTKSLIASLIAEAKKQNKKTVVDPKYRDFSVYAGASIITPNLAELESAHKESLESDEDVVKAAKTLIKKHKFGAVLVTRGKDGMSLVTDGGKVEHFQAEAQEVFDVSGAGDTVVANIATAIAAGFEIEEAVYIANVAAGIVVGRIGTAQVFRTDLKTALVTQDLISGTHKILPKDAADNQIEQWRKSGVKIGFTNGCFDLIHPGHVSLMDQAKSKCDKLVVGLNSDSSVRRLKGKERPIQNEMSRALVLASLEAVDMVIIFREDTPMNLIEMVKPDVLVKGADYKKEEVVGGEFVESYGGKIYLAKISKGQSTTGIVKKMSA